MNFCRLENYSCQENTPTSDLTARLAPFLTCSLSLTAARLPSLLLLFHWFPVCLLLIQNMWQTFRSWRGKYYLSSICNRKISQNIFVFVCSSETSQHKSHTAVFPFYYFQRLFSYCFEVELDHRQSETYSPLVYKHQLTHSIIWRERRKPAERVAVFMGKLVEKPLLSLICHKGDLCVCYVRALLILCIDSSCAERQDANSRGSQGTQIYVHRRSWNYFKVPKSES